jgi:hypothetical protein
METTSGFANVLDHQRTTTEYAALTFPNYTEDREGRIRVINMQGMLIPLHTTFFRLTNVANATMHLLPI